MPCASIRPAPNVLENPPIILSSTSQKIVYYSFFSTYYSYTILSSLLLQIIAGENGNNTYILPAQNEAHHHRHNYNRNNLSIDSLKFTKITSRSIARTWPSTIVDNIKINTEITLIEQLHRDTRSFCSVLF